MLSRRVSVVFAIFVVTAGCKPDRRGAELNPDAQVSDPGVDADAPFIASCVDNPDYVGRMGSDHRYRFVDMRMNYDEAYAFCSTEGAHLAVVNDDAENDFLRGLATSSAWLGHNDLTVESDFRTVTGESVAFSNWLSSEPNDNGGEDCVELMPTADGMWNDNPCMSDFRFLCECNPDYRAPAVPACMTDQRYTVFPRGRRYREGTGSLVSWDEAQQDCMSEGAHLVVISDIDEHIRVSQNTNADLLWIGYTDRATEGEFEWIDGSDSAFVAWASGQPDNSGPDEEDCTLLATQLQTWNDVSCTEPFQYLCECNPGYVAR